MAPGEKLAVEDVRVGWTAPSKAKLMAPRICGPGNRMVPVVAHFLTSDATSSFSVLAATHTCLQKPLDNEFIPHEHASLYCPARRAS
eukprot:551906-Pleurochrysis_carterae.AAC.1